MSITNDEREAREELILAIRQVVEAWDGGDLAAAVNNAREVADQFDEKPATYETDDVLSVTCRICGFSTTDKGVMDLWNGYGSCLGPNGHGEQHSVWVMKNGEVAIIAHDSNQEEEVHVRVNADFPDAITVDSPFHDPQIKVGITKSAGKDNAVVVFVDTQFEPNGSDGGPGLRVLINDDPTYEGVAFDPREDD